MPAFTRVAILQVKLLYSSRSQLFWTVVTPVAWAIILGLVFRKASESRAAVAVLGTGLMGTWLSVLFAAASMLQNNRRLGTLEPLMATPMSLFRVTASASSGATLFGLVPITASIATGALILRLPMMPHDPLIFVTGMVMVIFSLAAVGVALAPLFLLYPHATVLANIGDYPAFILSGLIVPLTYLPYWLRPFSYLFPPSLAIRICQQAMISHIGLPAVAICACCAGSTLTLIAGSGLLRKVEITALRRGVLGLS